MVMSFVMHFQAIKRSPFFFSFFLLFFSILFRSVHVSFDLFKYSLGDMEEMRVWSKLM